MIDLSLEHDADTGPCGALFANADWRVLADGLEHRGTGYFIARDTLAARRSDELWEWPLHLSEKSWCTSRLLREAFMAALETFGIEPDASLARSFAAGFGMRAGSNGGAYEGFVALGQLVRPKPVERKRPVASDGRSAARGRIPARGRLTAGAGA